jgi:outer membrane protein OmpA-like peptidoglycan-associated protein
MIPKIWITVLTLASLHSAIGQNIFRDDFIKEDNRWKRSAPSAQPSLENGVLKLNTTRTAAITYSHPLKAQADRDFAISSAIRLTGTQGNAGVMWGSTRDYYAFVINTEGKACLYRVSNGGYVQIVEWTECPQMLKEGLNTLSVASSGEKFTFSINNSRAFETPPLTFTYFSAGLFVGAETTVECDYLEFTQSQGVIKSVENSIRGVRDLGKAINSISDESTPCISTDGSILFFSRAISDLNTDIYVSEKTAQGWSPSKDIGPPMNNTGPNYVVSTSVDRQTLFLANKYSKDGSMIIGEGISISRRTKNGWSTPKAMPIRNLVNHARFIYYSISANTRTMIISMQSQRERFDLDLYVSFLEKDSTWSTPIILPPSINTLANEAMSYLASDEVTLYYSTNGKPGYGEYDLFVTRRLDDTWTRWSEPLNLGRAVNSKESEMFISVPSRGNECYLAMETQDGKGNIFAVTLPRTALPEAISVVSGKVYDRKTNKPIEAEIEFENLSTQKQIGVVKTSAVDGSFKIAVTRGFEYGIRGKAEGYYPISTNINAKNLKEYQEITRDLFLVPIKTGAIIKLNNLFFDVNNATIKAESYPELNRLGEFLTENPGTQIEVSGHTDNTGTEAFNQELSLRRAQAVAQFLKRHNSVKPDQIAVRGYGQSQPVSSNNSEEGRQMNRRVEFKLIKK